MLGFALSGGAIRHVRCGYHDVLLHNTAFWSSAASHAQILVVLLGILSDWVQAVQPFIQSPQLHQGSTNTSTHMINAATDTYDTCGILVSF